MEPTVSNLDPRARIRAIEMANEIVRLDRQYKKRLDYLRQSRATDYHIDNDIVLRNLSGGARVLSDMASALALVHIMVEGEPPK
jgi:hypothetical protein